MSKTLTEQWREGTLPDGWYYLKVKSELANYPVIAECVINYSSLKPYSDFYEYDDSHVEEVLAPVPSYDKVKEMSQKIERLEFDNEALEMAHNEGKEINAELVSKTEQLEKRLEIATKALKEIHECTDWADNAFIYATEALKEMEGVK